MRVALLLVLLVLPPFARASDKDIFVCLAGLANVEQRLSAIGKANWPKDIVDLTGSGKTLAIDGVPVTEFTPGADHHPGQANDGTYRVMRDGKPHLVKVLGGGDNKKERLPELQSVLLAQEAGGPKIRRAGTIVLPDGSRAQFIEMEELFPGRPSFTLKGASPFRAGGGVDKFVEGNPRPTRLMADLFVRAWEKGLVPDSDADFIFADGRAAWLDASWWQRKPEVVPEYLRGVQRTWIQLRPDQGGDRRGADAFTADLLTSIEASPVLKPDAKTKLRELIEKYRPK